MTLDKQSMGFLARRAEAAIAGTSTRSLGDIRASREAWRRQSADEVVPVHAVTELLARSDRGEIPVRIYRPSEARQLPAIVYLHGGGWVLGDLEHSEGICRELCNATGCIMVNVDYRLAPEHRYPAAVDDSYAALCWLEEEASTLGADPTRLAIAGSSAGGNLAAATALMVRDRNGPACRAQLLIYPVLDNACNFSSYEEFAEGYIVSTADMRWYWQQYLSAASQGDEPYACPLKAVSLGGLPPALVITAENDPVRDDGEAYARRLAEAGVPAKLSRYPGTLHGFFANPRSLDKARLAHEEAAGFLLKALHAEDTR